MQNAKYMLKKCHVKLILHIEYQNQVLQRNSSYSACIMFKMLSQHGQNLMQTGEGTTDIMLSSIGINIKNLTQSTIADMQTSRAKKFRNKGNQQTLLQLAAVQHKISK